MSKGAVRDGVATAAAANGRAAARRTAPLSGALHFFWRKIKKIEKRKQYVLNIPNRIASIIRDFSDPAQTRYRNGVGPFKGNNIGFGSGPNVGLKKGSKEAQSK